MAGTQFCPRVVAALMAINNERSQMRQDTSRIAVGAIKQSGEINMNECFYCLDCQVAYYADQICPPMVWRRKLLERASESQSTPVRMPSR